MSRTIWTNGCFDGGLHVGHVNLLMQCRTFAGRHGRVIVGLDSDMKVKADKGFDRPIYSEDDRLKHLSLLQYPIDSLLVPVVDEIYFFNTNEQLYELIKKVKPDIIVKGSDWKNNVIGSDLAETIIIEKQGDVSVSKMQGRILRNSSGVKPGFTDFNPEI